MDGKLTMLIQPLTGLRLLDDDQTEEGSIVAFRREGDECLYIPRVDGNKGMEWIPVGRFSVDPEAVTPPELLDPGEEAAEEEAASEDQPIQERPSRSGPMGRQLRRRPELG